MYDIFIDPVVEEIHAIRATMLASIEGGIDELMQQVGERQQRSRRTVIRKPLRNRPEQNNQTKSQNPAF